MCACTRIHTVPHSVSSLHPPSLPPSLLHSPSSLLFPSLPLPLPPSLLPCIGSVYVTTHVYMHIQYIVSDLIYMYMWGPLLVDLLIPPSSSCMIVRTCPTKTPSNSSIMYVHVTRMQGPSWTLFFVIPEVVSPELSSLGSDRDYVPPTFHQHC